MLIFKEIYDRLIELQKEVETELKKKGLKLDPTQGNSWEAAAYIYERNELGHEYSAEQWVKETYENYPEYFIEA